jgi:hypothetical protein
VTAAKIRKFLGMDVLPEDGRAAFEAALNDYAVLEVTSKMSSAIGRSPVSDRPHHDARRP